MRIRFASLIPLLIASTAGCTDPLRAPTRAAERPEDPTSGAVAEVRRGYFGRDWWACARAGEASLAAHPDSAPLRAWTINCASRAGEDVLPLAESMLAEKPGDPWGLFARASVLIDHPRRGAEEAIPAAQEAARVLGHLDATWLVARALVVHGSRAEATAFFAGPRPPSPELLAMELALLIETPGDVEKQMLALAEQLRALDSTSVDGWFLPGAWLQAHQRPAEAEPMLLQALERSPHSPAIHAQLWQAIARSPARSPADRRAAIEADITALLRVRADDPAALGAAANAYDDLSPEAAKRLRAEVLTRFPDSPEADWVRIKEIQGLAAARAEAKRPGKNPDPVAEQALHAALDAFIARPRHALPDLLAEALLWRYLLAKDDPSASPEALLAAAQDFAAHTRTNLHILADAAKVLAERTTYHAEAEAIARESLRLAASRFARASPEEADYARELRSVLLCGLGATLQAQKRFAEAREALQEAHNLDRGAAEPYIRLAALAEAEGQPAEAERRLLEALALEAVAEPAETALKALYRRRHGSERGFDKYRVRVMNELREQRKAVVLATRIAEPKPVVPFVLPRLTGGKVSSETLSGRVTVINLWSTTCHPCVEELPSLQELVDAFAGAPDVGITTINTDPGTDGVAPWMTERGYRFEVLLGASWYFEAGYKALPTTLFIDPHGRVVFIKEGRTDRLVEEFTWRIDALRSPSTSKRKEAKRGASTNGRSSSGP